MTKNLLGKISGGPPTRSRVQGMGENCHNITGFRNTDFLESCLSCVCPAHILSWIVRKFQFLEASEQSGWDGGTGGCIGENPLHSPLGNLMNWVFYCMNH